MFKPPYLIVCIFVVTAFTSQVKAQFPVWTHYTDKDGLPNNEVYDMYQDKKGFIWFGTLNGLSRFDGVRFERFESTTQKTPHISGLAEDGEGRIWGQNFTNQLFFLEKNQLEEFTYWNHRKSVVYSPFTFTQENQLLTTNGNALIQFHFQDSSWIDVAPTSVKKHPFFSSFVTSLQKFDDKIWFISNLHGIAYLQNDKITSISYSETQLNKLFGQIKSSSFLFASFVKNNRLYLVEYSLKKPQIFYIENDSLIHDQKLSERIGIHFKGHLNTFVTKEGFIWISTNKSIEILNPDFTENKELSEKLPPYRISKALVDREGNYWLSTLGYGVFMIKNFDIEVFNKSSKSLTEDYITRLLFLDKNTLAIGDKNGTLSLFDTQKKKIISSYETPTVHEIGSITKSNKGNTLYFSSFDLWEINKNKANVDQTLPLFLIKDLHIDSEDNYFVSTAWSFQFIKNKNATKSYDYLIKHAVSKAEINGNTSYTLSNERNTANWFDEQNNELWMAHNGKLEVITKSDRFEVLNPQNKSIYVRTIFKSKDGTVWVGTENEGVYGFNNFKITSHFSTQNLLKSNTIRNILQTDFLLWIGTTNGLHKINLNTSQVSYINHLDGLPANDIFHLVFEPEEQHIWLATASGLVQLPSNYEGINKVTSVSYINSVLVNGELIEADSDLNLSYKENNLTFNFQSPLYKSEGQYTFKYRLKGLRDSWVSTPANSNFVLYSALQPGDYQFEVYSENEDGISSEQAALFAFTIKSPFWATWWFYIISFIGLVSLIYTVLDYRLRVYKREVRFLMDKQQAEKDLRSSQLASIRSQMNPHFIFNALNSIQSYIFSDDKRKANELLGKFAELVRTILKNSELEFISLEEEIKSLWIYIDLENDRHEEKFCCTIKLADDVDKTQIKFPPMLIQPFVENSIKHGFLHKNNKDCALNILIDWEIQDQLLRVMIDDNGIGRQRARQISLANKNNHNRFAMRANEKRLEILNTSMNKTIGVEIVDKESESKESLGTLVILRIPVDQS